MMHLKSISLRNFKSFQNEEVFDLAPITLFTGTNSSGKSNVIKSIVLLRNSIKENLYFQSLNFSSHRKLGDFEGSQNFKNDVNQTIDFCLPLNVKYLDGDFFVALKFSQEEKTSNINGRLAGLEIFKHEGEAKTPLIYFRLDVTKEFFNGGEITTNLLTRSEIWTKDYAIKKEGGYRINLRYLIDFISSLKDTIENNKLFDKASINISSFKKAKINSIEDYLLENRLSNEEKIQRYIEKIKSKAFTDRQEPVFHKFHQDNRLLNIKLHTGHSLDLYDILNQTIEFDTNSVLYNYFQPVGIKKQEQDDKRIISDTVMRIIRSSEKAAIDSLSETNNFLGLEIEPIYKSYLSKDGFLRQFILERIDDKFSFFVTEQHNYNDVQHLSIAGRFIIEKLLLENVENAFKQLRSTLDVHYLSSLRGDQNRIQSKSGFTTDLNDLIDQYINLEVDKNEYVKEFINYWLNYLEIGNSLSYETGASGTINALYITKDKQVTNIADLGFGISQIIPVILQISICGYNYLSFLTPTTICIEEPEANLHPALQSKLADLLIDASNKFKIQFIIETHSEYLIRKMQYWIANKTIEPAAVALYYFNNPEKIDDGETQVKKINIREDGMLEDDFGEGFYDEATRLTFQLLKIQSFN